VDTPQAAGPGGRPETLAAQAQGPLHGRTAAGEAAAAADADGEGGADQGPHQGAEDGGPPGAEQATERLPPDLAAAVEPPEAAVLG
jgi:hypothetical protein